MEQYKKGRYNIKQRIDRILVSTYWFSLFPNVFVWNMQIRASNFAHILLKYYMHTTPLYKPFHFIITWYKDPSSKEIVTQAWKLKYPCYVQLNFHFNSIKLAKDFT